MLRLDRWALAWKGGAGRLAAAVLVALALVAAQTAVLAHASSHEAHAPAHNGKTCVLHVNGDRPASAVAPDCVVAAAPQFERSERVVAGPNGVAVFRIARLVARGPPVLI